MDRTLQLAWAAGFVDGEGYIGITRWFDKKRGYHTHRVQFDIAQVHEKPIRMLSEMFGNVGRVNRIENDKRGYWAWRVMGSAVVPVVRELLPYLVVKDEQARLVMEFEFTVGKGRKRELPEDVKRRRRALWAERLSEEAPTGDAEGDAIVRPHGNRNRESEAETSHRLKLA